MGVKWKRLDLVLVHHGRFNSDWSLWQDNQLIIIFFEDKKIDLLE